MAKVSFMLRRIAVVFAVAACAALSAPAAATPLKSRTGVVLHGPAGSWERCQSTRCLRYLRSLKPSAVRQTVMPAKRQRGGYRDRSAYHGPRYHGTGRPRYRPPHSYHRPYHRRHDSGAYIADENGLSRGCHTVYIPYGWTWYCASSCE